LTREGQKNAGSRHAAGANRTTDRGLILRALDQDDLGATNRIVLARERQLQPLDHRKPPGCVEHHSRQRISRPLSAQRLAPGAPIAQILQRIGRFYVAPSAYVGIVAASGGE
jgi:hypothetical protein